MPGTENGGGLRRIRWALWGLVVLAVLSQYVRQPALKDKADKLKEPQQ